MALISLNQARNGRITKVRLPHWANKADHLELYISPDGHLGVWAKLWSPVNELIGEQNPQTVPLIGKGWDFDTKEWEPYNAD